MSHWVFDTEIYRNFYLVAFKNMATKEVRSFRTPFNEDDQDGILDVLKNHTVIGFNSLNFDLPILQLALEGVSDSELKDKCDAIIKNNIRWWQNNEGIPPCKDHIDIIEVAPGIASLKIYGGRLNSPRMQSLPVHHDKVLTEEEKDLIEEYCVNDLDVTEMLARSVGKQLKIRRHMSKQYKVNVMSKSDAQIAEAVIKGEMETSRRTVNAGHTFKYTAPKWMDTRVSRVVEKHEFVVQNTGKVKLPEFFPKNEILIAGKGYKMGIGGLHSMEKRTSHYASKGVIISDHDVASYYPSIILNEELYPSHLGDMFLEVYRDIVDKRLAAKSSGDKVTSDTLKIVINGSFGKFGSKWSVLYAPELLIQVTLTGQLALLMLIDDFEAAGIPVLSANTDGVVVKCPIDMLPERDAVIAAWEAKTGFDTEETRYRSLHSRDVNNYLAVKPDGSYKGKGCFTKPSLGKNTEHPIVYSAVAEYLAHGTSIDSTIKSCDDMSKFCSIRTVKGGALSQEGEELGTAIRWYYSLESQGPITYALNGNKVPKTDGAVPLMELGGLRDDINYQWYIDAAKEVLKGVGIDY